MQRPSRLIGFYEERGLLHRISAAGKPEEVHAQIVEILEQCSASRSQDMPRVEGH